MDNLDNTTRHGDEPGTTQTPLNTIDIPETIPLDALKREFETAFRTNEYMDELARLVSAICTNYVYAHYASICDAASAFADRDGLHMESVGLAWRVISAGMEAATAAAVTLLKCSDRCTDHSGKWIDEQFAVVQSYGYRITTPLMEAYITVGDVFKQLMKEG